MADVTRAGLSELLKKHEKVFEKGLGTLKGVRVSIELEEGAEPKYMKARLVPYAIKPAVDKELDRLVDQGSYKPVTYSRWATPIVPVVNKENGSVRICGDYKLTVNPRAKCDKYPVPRTEDLLATLNGWKAIYQIRLKPSVSTARIRRGE